jgi:hypothetical protein
MRARLLISFTRGEHPERDFGLEAEYVAAI